MKLQLPFTDSMNKYKVLFLLMRKVSSSISSRASFSQYFHKLFSYHTVARIQPLNPPVLEVALPDLVIEPNHLLRLYIQDLTEVLIDARADEVVRRLSNFECLSHRFVNV